MTTRTSAEWQTYMTARMIEAKSTTYPGSDVDMCRYREAACREEAARHRAFAPPDYVPTMTDLLILAADDDGNPAEGLMAELYGIDRIAWRERLHAMRAAGLEALADAWRRQGDAMEQGKG